MDGIGACVENQMLNRLLHSECLSIKGYQITSCCVLLHSKEEPKGADCFPSFENMHNCFSKYPELYKSRGDDDDEEEEEDVDTEQVQFDEDELKVIEEETDESGKASPRSGEQQEKNKTNQPESPPRREPLIPVVVSKPAVI